MRQIPIGVKGSSLLEIKGEHLANRLKDGLLPPVLATPVMIAVMENAALNAIKAYLEPAETALGTRVDIRHLSPSTFGTRIICEARVTRVDGRRIEFWVAAIDENGQIGTGTHERVIVEYARIERHLEAKRSAQAHLRRANGDWQ
jgi:fluoroacetyl-CoA thioesterase